MNTEFQDKKLKERNFIYQLIVSLINRLLKFASLGMTRKNFPINEILYVQTVALFSLSSIAFSVFFITIYTWLGLYLIVTTISINLIIAVASLFYLKKTYNAELVAHIILVLFLTVLIVANTQLGGFDNPNDSWFMVGVLVGGFILQRGSIWFYTLIIIIIITFFFLLKNTGADFPRLLTQDKLDILSLANRLASVISIAVLILLFRYERTARELSITQHEENVYRLANYDSLTQLYNRSYFAEQFNRQIEEYPELHQAILFIDLDSFKIVNDNFGHNVGDKLLQAVAERFKSQLKERDTICRHGGDEFLVMPARSESKEQVEEICLQLIRVLKKPFVVDDHTLHIGCSIGIAYYPENGKDYVQLLRAADIAMYRAKLQGSDQFQLYNNQLAAEVKNKNQMALELRQAIDEGKLSLVYQSKNSISKGEIVGFEALMRWKNTRGETIPPDIFIAIAEEFGLVSKLGEWLIGAVCKQLIDWQREGKPIKKVAVNVSAKQLLRADFVSEFVRITNYYNISSELIDLELTESVFIESSNEILLKLNKLHDLGFSLVIDDYGTGYASLGYLKRFPVSGLKIDKSFIDEISENEQDQTIVKSTIGLAHQLGLEIIAEGVENKQQLELLKNLGCDIIQGYYFSAPLEPHEVFK